MFVRLDGIRLYYETHGRGQPVVFVHGLGLTADMWRYQIEAIAPSYRIIALDTRGHGRSDKPPGPYTMAMYVQDMLGLLDHLGLKAPVVIGLSMGGGIAQSIALAAPERARALGLISTGSDLQPEIRERLHRNAGLVERDGMGALDEVPDAYWAPSSFVERADDVERVRQTIMANDPVAYAAAARANAARDWTARLPEIRCPVIYIGGDGDRSTPRRARVFREGLPDVEVHILPGVSHLLPLEAPEVVNDLLRFLARVT